MKKTLGIVAGLLLIGTAAALADRTTTVLSAPAKVQTMNFVINADNTVHANVCGSTTYSDGGATPVICHGVLLPAANSIAVSVRALGAGQGLTFWRQQETD